MSIDRANQLWRHLAGLFGADSLERKFGKSPPAEWAGLLRTVNDFELQRGIRRMSFSGKSHIPTLPEFLRMCREVGGEQFSDADAKAIPPSHQLEQKPQPRWMREANLHLLAHITRQAGKRVFYNAADTQPLIEAKNAWAENMLEAEQVGTLPADNGAEWWQYAVANAEAVIELQRRQRAA